MALALVPPSVVALTPLSVASTMSLPVSELFLTFEPLTEFPRSSLLPTARALISLARTALRLISLAPTALRSICALPTLLRDSVVAA